MAEGDRPPVAPELHLAGLLLRREGVQPPVPVHDLLATRAHIEHAAIPGSIDGLVYRRAGDSRPRVILNTRGHPARLKFTLAHELGHLILPWHSGTVFCHTDPVDGADDAMYAEVEREANRFAGELLVPLDWARRVIESTAGELAARILEIARLAEVSPVVAVLSLARALDHCVFFVTRGEETLVALHGAAFGAWGRPRWSRGAEQDYRRQGGRCTTRGFGPFTLHCVEFELTHTRRRVADASVQLLQTIAGELGAADGVRARLIATVNGVIGSANARAPARSARHLELVLRARFAQRPDLRAVVAHARFPDFLTAKAHEITRARRARQPG